MENQEYISMFIEESTDHIQTLNDKLLNLERNLQDVSIVQEIFRSAHTLKGMASSMGFNDMAHFTHEMENALDSIRNGRVSVTKELVDVLFSCADILQNQLDKIINESTDVGVDYSDTLGRLSTVLNGSPSEDVTKIQYVDASLYREEKIQAIVREGKRVVHIRVTIDAFASMNAVRAFMVTKEIESAGKFISSIPIIDDLSANDFGNEFHIFIEPAVSDDDLKVKILSVSEISDVQIIDVPHLDEKDVQKNQSSQEGTKREPKDESKKKASKTFRVDVERIDALMEFFTEFIIDRNRIHRISERIRDKDLSEAIEHMSRISKSMQEVIMSVRMIPIDNVFSRFPRMVRDLSKTLDKPVDFHISGEDTELDRTLIEEIGDPLVHILRNALDHGLENKDERKQCGKPETGTIALSAYQSGNHVMIEVKDDGKGIDRDKILKKAIERGLVDENRASSLNDEQVFDFLFQSGFSTAKEISDISGRGVGLDVVKNKIHSLGGDVVVQSELGCGSTFLIRLPLTLSIVQAFMCNIGQQTFCIPINYILQMLMVPASEIQSTNGQNVFLFRDKVVPLIDLRAKFLYPATERKQYNVLVLNKGDKQVGCIVDDFLGQEEIVLKSLGEYLGGSVKGVSGATILGDGNVALIADVNSIV